MGVIILTKRAGVYIVAHARVTPVCEAGWKEGRAPRRRADSRRGHYGWQALRLLQAAALAPHGKDRSPGNMNVQCSQKRFPLFLFSPRVINFK